MAKLTARQLILSLLLFVLFSPVFLPIGMPELRPAWFVSTIGGVAVYPLIVASLIVVFVILAWIFSRGAFGASTSRPDDEAGQ
jgi:hypothetical protein